MISRLALSRTDAGAKYMPQPDRVRFASGTMSEDLMLH